MRSNDSWIADVVEASNKTDSSLNNEGTDTSTQEVEEQQQESKASASSQEESGEQESQTAQSETQTAQEESESTTSENEEQTQKNRDTQTETSSKEEASTEENSSEAQATQQGGEDEPFDQNAFFESLKTETENDPEFKKQLLESLGVEENPQPQFDNPELEQAYKFVNETGRSLQEYTFLQQLDTDKMDGEQAIRIQMTLDYPDLTQEDINELIDSKYNVDADEVGDKQARLAEIQKKQDASQALNKIKGYKEEWSKPVEGHDPNKKQEGSNSLESVLGMDKDTFNQSLNEASDIDTLSVDLGRDGEFDFELKDGFSENFKKQYFSSDDPFKYYRNEDGSFDVNKIYLASLFFENADSMAKAVASKAKSEATEKVVKDKKNVNYNEEHKEPPQQNNVQEQNKEVLKRFGFK